MKYLELINESCKANLYNMRGGKINGFQHFFYYPNILPKLNDNSLLPYLSEMTIPSCHQK